MAASERPLSLSDAEVRVLLAGRKTQHRVPVNVAALEVSLPECVSSDIPWFVEPVFAAEAGSHRAIMNPLGAVSVLVGDKTLGVKPGEFHFVCPFAEGTTHLADLGEAGKRWTIT